jgi:segregation and condensation protein A
LAQIRRRDPDSLADFLVVAAKLLLIKSRVLLPQPESPPPSDEEDAGDDLLRQLVEYKRYKEAAGWLARLEEKGLRSYIRMAAPPPLERSIDLGDTDLDDLLAAVRQALAVKPPAPSVDNGIPPIQLTVADQMSLIERETAQQRTISFLGLLERTKNRLEIVVTLLALLELIKQRRVSVHQEQLFGDIEISGKEPVATPNDA